MSGSLTEKHFVCKGENIISPSWDHDKEHRDVVLRKLERIQALVVILDTGKNPQANDQAFALIQWALGTQPESRFEAS